MNKIDLENSKNTLFRIPEVKKGLALFEKYYGEIKFLKREEEPPRAGKYNEYIIKDLDGNEIYRSKTIRLIAQEMCVSSQTIVNCVNRGKLIKQKYTITRRKAGKND